MYFSILYDKFYIIIIINVQSELPHIQIPDEVYREYLGKKAAEKYIKKEIKQEVDDTTFSSGYYFK